jgi:hypothetical protein
MNSYLNDYLTKNFIKKSFINVLDEEKYETELCASMFTLTLSLSLSRVCAHFCFSPESSQMEQWSGYL